VEKQKLSANPPPLRVSSASLFNRKPSANPLPLRVSSAPLFNRKPPRTLRLSAYPPRHSSTENPPRILRLSARPPRHSSTKTSANPPPLRVSSASLLNCKCPYRESPNTFKLRRHSGEQQICLRQAVEITHMLNYQDVRPQQDCVNRSRLRPGVVNIV